MRARPWCPLWLTLVLSVAAVDREDPAGVVVDELVQDLVLIGMKHRDRINPEKIRPTVYWQSRIQTR